MSQRYQRNDIGAASETYTNFTDRALVAVNLDYQKVDDGEQFNALSVFPGDKYHLRKKDSINGKKKLGGFDDFDTLTGTHDRYSEYSGKGILDEEFGDLMEEVEEVWYVGADLDEIRKVDDEINWGMNNRDAARYINPRFTLDHTSRYPEEGWVTENGEYDTLDDIARRRPDLQNMGLEEGVRQIMDDVGVSPEVEIAVFPEEYFAGEKHRPEDKVEIIEYEEGGSSTLPASQRSFQHLD